MRRWPTALPVGVKMPTLTRTQTQKAEFTARASAGLRRSVTPLQSHPNARITGGVKPAVALVILLFALLGCEKKVLSDQERAGNFVIAWLEQNELQGDFSGLIWRVEKNMDGEYELFHEKRRKGIEGLGDSYWIESILDKEDWRDWAITGHQTLRGNLMWFSVNCPFTSWMEWSVIVKRKGDGFEISNVHSLNNQARLAPAPFNPP